MHTRITFFTLPSCTAKGQGEPSRTDRARTLSASFGLLDRPDLGRERVDVVLGAGPPTPHVPRVQVGPPLEGGRVARPAVVRPPSPPLPTAVASDGGRGSGGVALLAAPLVADQLKCTERHDRET